MTSPVGQKVIGRHEVFEYTYRVGPTEERKRIKLVVIQRREQRRRSQILATKYATTPVRLRVNLHRAQYGDPEVVSGSRQIPITLRRKPKAAAAPATTVVRHAAPASPRPPEPARIELVDRPINTPSSSEYVDDPPPAVVVVPPSQASTPEPPHRAPSLARSSSGSSVGRTKVKRSNSITSGFRRFPSLMGIIRRNSKSSAPPSVAPGDHNAVVVGDHFDHRASNLEDDLVIVEERDSELGSPIANSARYGPPSVAGSGYSRKPVPPIPESISSGRSNRSRNKLVKASPRHVPLPDSVRQSNGTGIGSPHITGAFPAHIRQSAEYEPARSVTSRHTAERMIGHGPEYTETYLHDSPSARSRSLHDESLRRSRSINDGASARTHDRSLHDVSVHNRSAHDLSMRTPSRHSHEASVRDGSFRDGISLHDMNGGHSPSLREPSLHNPSLREHSIRDQSIREHSLRGGGSIRDGGLLSPTASMREVLSDGDRENDHTHEYIHGSPLHSRVGSPSLHAPSSRVASPPLHAAGGSIVHAPSYRSRSPSIVVPSHRGASPSLHAPSHRGASPSLHAPSHRGDSPSLHAPSRIASPALYDQSFRGESPPASMHAPSVRSRAAESVASSRHHGSSITGRNGLPGGFARPRSPLSASGSSHASSRRTNTPRGPEITPVPIAPSIASHRTTASRNGLKSPLSRVASPPISEAPPVVSARGTASVAGSHRSGRSELPYQTALPPSTYAPSAISHAPSAIPRSTSAAGISRVPSAAAISRAPSATGSRAPTAVGRTISRAPSAATVVNSTSPPRAPSAAGIGRSPSAAGISRAPGAAEISRAPSVAPSAAGHGIIRAPSAARVPLPPSVIGTTTSRAPSAAAISRAPSAARTHRALSPTGTHRQAPSVSVSQRIPPSVIGSQHIPPSIAGSAPSRHTPPPEHSRQGSEFLPAPSDIAPESESHGGQALRAQARLEGDKMSMFMQMSQQAYKEGDGAKAKELAEIGRQHQVKMEELHAEAASQIFREKNAGRGENEIDLHGLRVKEAQARLSRFIREAPLAGQTTLRVITGKGLHSERGEARIIPAVEEMLRNKGLRHHTDEVNPGVIVVELGPRSPVSE